MTKALNITEKGELYRRRDSAMSPGAMLTLELIARFPGMETESYRDIYVVLLERMTVDEALIYVKSGDLEREAASQP